MDIINNFRGRFPDLDNEVIKQLVLSIMGQTDTITKLEILQCMRITNEHIKRYALPVKIFHVREDEVMDVIKKYSLTDEKEIFVKRIMVKSGANNYVNYMELNISQAIDSRNHTRNCEIMVSLAYDPNVTCIDYKEMDFSRAMIVGSNYTANDQYYRICDYYRYRTQQSNN
jgi:ribonucleotide monophosphatase NagD (HAD superfamily)